MGFQYQYDPKINQYAHATAIMVLTPQGRISRYFYGVDFPPKDLRMGLVEASQGKIGNAVDQVLLYCYHYDPATGKYGAIVSNILRLGAGVTILVLGSLSLHPVPPGEGRTAKKLEPGRNRVSQDRVTGDMFDNFPLWPDRASTAAGNVDALFIFLLIVSGLDDAADLYRRGLLRRPLPPANAAFRPSRSKVPLRWS